jgi:hypothetical protein
MNCTCRGATPLSQPKEIEILRYDAAQAPVQKEDQQKVVQRRESDELFFVFYLSLLHRCSGLSTNGADNFIKEHDIRTSGPGMFFAIQYPSRLFLQTLN